MRFCSVLIGRNKYLCFLDACYSYMKIFILFHIKIGIIILKTYKLNMKNVFFI